MCVHLLVSHLVKDPPLLTRRFVVFLSFNFYVHFPTSS